MGWVEMCAAGLALGALVGSSREPFLSDPGDDMVQVALVGGAPVENTAGMPFAFVRIGASGCSGVLIHKRAVLTAEHCLGLLKKLNFVMVGSKSKAWPTYDEQMRVLKYGKKNIIIKLTICKIKDATPITRVERPEPK